MRYVFSLVLFLVLLPPAGAEPRVRVFVDKIERTGPGKPDEKYRLLLVKELQKLKSVEIVDDRAAAEYIVTGRGQVSGGGREWQDPEEEGEGQQAEDNRERSGAGGDGDLRQGTDRQVMGYTDRTAELSVTVTAPGHGTILSCRKSVTRSAEFSWLPEEVVVKQVVKQIKKNLKWE